MMSDVATFFITLTPCLLVFMSFGVNAIWSEAKAIRKVLEQIRDKG